MKATDLPRPFGTMEALESLRATECPACGGAKISMQSLCADCYRDLPKRMGRALWKPMRSGYEAAINAALDQLAPVRGAGEEP